MTTKECARLQSMEGLKHLPEGELAVRALGNAVNVKVAELVLQLRELDRRDGWLPAEVAPPLFDLLLRRPFVICVGHGSDSGICVKRR